MFEMLRFLAKASVTVFVVTVAVLVLGVLGFGIASIWGFGVTIDKWPVWFLTFWRVFLTILVVDLIPFGLGVIYLQESNK